MQEHVNCFGNIENGVSPLTQKVVIILKRMDKHFGSRFVQIEKEKNVQVKKEHWWRSH